ncbi:MAG: UvrD-helicase domain-containing protein [Actinomycetota bacterium]
MSDELNPPQRAAVLHDGGPLLVLAGAGSGKTRVLTHRIAHLVGERGVAPWSVLAITFTNKAAGEIRERLAALVGPRARELWAGTFHSMCARILRRECDAAGYPRDFSIYDEADQLRVLRACFDDVGLDQKQVPPRTVLYRISDAKSRLLTPDALAAEAASFADQRIVDLYRRYQDRLRAAGAMDFDDILMVAVELLEQGAEVRDRYQRRFEHVLVDEYQDTNHAQYRLVRVLGEPQRNVMVVGDDDQGIYSWRGADVRNILDFERDYPDATVVALEQNYRSTGTILRAANAVVARNPRRHPKELWTDSGDGEPIRMVTCRDEREEALVVAGEVDRALDAGEPLSEVAVFYRTNAQSRAIEDTLVRRGVPYQVIGGPRFYERAEVKDLLSYLRAVVNPMDAVAVARLMGAPKRGLGPGCLEKLAGFAAVQGLPVADALGHGEMVSGLTARQRQEVADTAALLAELRRLDASGAPVGRIMEAALDGSGLRAVLEDERTPEAQGRLETLRELVATADDYQARAEEPTLSGFLEEIALYADADQVARESGQVTLMTIHNAKGLEFDTVVMVGLEEGLFPHQRSMDSPDALEEERRLFYVGLTRARRRLVLAHADTRAMFGGRDYRLPSRFLREIPADALDTPRRPRRRGEGLGAPAPAGPALATGDTVVHATFGEGVITGVEQGGELVLVHFSADGTERRLMAGYAPMRKVTS